MSEKETPALPEMASLWKETLSWQPSAAKVQQFQRLYELIVLGNRQMNLTRITEPMDFWEKHLWDSLRGIAPLLKAEGERENSETNLSTIACKSLLEKSQLKAIDIGTGAGFPGLPVAIALPNCTVTLLDSTRKKIAFLNTLVTSLELENVITFTGRAEEIGQKPLHRQNYDLAFIRAVGTASVCAEYALPLLKTGGLAVIYRGKWSEEEAAAFNSAVEQLGGAIASIEAYTTPITSSVRHCLYLRKIAPTKAAFPRPVGVPDRQPL